VATKKNNKRRRSSDDMPMSHAMMSPAAHAKAMEDMMKTKAYAPKRKRTSKKK